MSDRCSAFVVRGQCRATKSLTRTRITIHRETTFVAKLPEQAIILLCPKHLQITSLERLVLSGRRFQKVGLPQAPQTTTDGSVSSPEATAGRNEVGAEKPGKEERES